MSVLGQKSINGYGAPRFKIYEPISSQNNRNPGSLLDTIDLRLTGKEGLIEEYEWFEIKHQNLADYSIEIEPQGVRVWFTLDYKEYSENPNSMKIGKLIDYLLAKKKVVLYPRQDLAIRSFEIFWDKDNKMQIGLMKNGINAIGNRLIQLKFYSKYIYNSSTWIDPNAVIYGCYLFHNRCAVRQ